MFKCKALFVSILILKFHVNSIFQSEFCLSAAVTKRYQCTQQDVRKNVGNSLPHAP